MRVTLALVATLSWTALAQDAGTPAPEAPKAEAPKPEAAAPAPPAAAPAPATPRPPPARQEITLEGPSDPERVAGYAKLFFQALLQSDARRMADLSTTPFQLEGQRLDTADALVDEWLRHLRSKRTDLLTLYGITVHTPAEMEQKHGKAPARLSALPLRGDVYVAVANLSGRPAIAVFKKVGTDWKAAAYTD